MDVLVLDGKNYVKASKAAKELGYATDYVGQLCRSGQVDAHLIGRTWYVNQDELSTHKVEKKRMSRVKAREYAKKSIAESKIKKVETTNVYKKLAIRYEHDDESLLPETKKLLVKTEVPRRTSQEFPEADEMSIVNKGEKVRMSGKLNVTDATDISMDSDTTVLRPTIIKITENSEVTKPKASKEEVFKSEDVEIIKPKISFVDRLEESNIHIQKETPEPITDQGIDTVAIKQEEIDPIERKNEFSLIASLMTVGIVLLFSVLSIGVSEQIEYIPLEKGIFISETSYNFSFSTTKELISSKI